MRRRGITTAKRWSYEEDAALMDLVGQEVAPNWQAKVYALARIGFPRRSKDDVQKKGEAMLAEGDDSLDILEESRLRTKAFSGEPRFSGPCSRKYRLLTPRTSPIEQPLSRQQNVVGKPRSRLRRLRPSRETTKRLPCLRSMLIIPLVRRPGSCRRIPP